MRPFYFILLLALVSHSAQAIYCPQILRNLFGLTRPVVQQVKKEFPSIDEFYSAPIQKDAVKAQKAFVKTWKPSYPDNMTELQKLQPFLDIELAVKENHLDIEDFGKKIKAWPKLPELAPYLYSQLSRFGNHAQPLLKWLTLNHPDFKGAIMTESPDFSLITFAYEKETHKPELADWYRPAKISEEDWFKKSLEERGQLLWKEHKAGFLSMNGKLVPTSRKPPMAGDAKFELPMASLDGGFVKSTPPIEFAHKRYEIRLSEVFRQMREVSSQLNESSAFHLHLVFPYPSNELDQFDKFGKWWKKLNDYAFLSGLEQGMHPNRLTRLPMEPLKNITALDSYSSSKYFGVGARGNMYGAALDNNHRLIGIELRDTTHNLNELEKLARKISQSLADRVWTKNMGYEEHPLMLRPNSAEETSNFLALAEAQGISATTAKLFYAVETNLGIPLHNFEGELKNLSEKDKQDFIAARRQFLNDLALTAKELESYQNKGEKIENDLLRLALRHSLTEWAKKTKPSRFFSDF